MFSLYNYIEFNSFPKTYHMYAKIKCYRFLTIFVDCCRCLLYRDCCQAAQLLLTYILSWICLMHHPPSLLFNSKPCPSRPAVPLESIKVNNTMPLFLVKPLSVYFFCTFLIYLKH